MAWVTENGMHWVAEARKYVNSTLTRLPKLFDSAFKDSAVDLLCKELDKLPVPFVGSILSKMVQEAVKPDDKPGPDLEEVLERLVQMEQSDEDFLQGLADTGVDIHRLEENITTLRKEMEGLRQDLTRPKFQLKFPSYKPRYPQADNELLFSLLNTGPGAVRVPEIHLDIEHWEPETRVIFTAPAAPPITLRLKVRLSTDCPSYPLLQLNEEPYRRFGAYSEGAEDICIQMSSGQNARYQVRLRIPYEDLATGERGELLYPPAGEPPILVSFPYAPAWDTSITPANMLAREAVLAEITKTFKQALQVLADAQPSWEEGQRQITDEQLRQAGFSMGLAYLPYVLNQFLPPLAQLIKEEQQPQTLLVVLELAHQALRHLEIAPPGAARLFGFQDRAVDDLCQGVDRPELQEQVRLFFTQPAEGRQKILTEIKKAF